MHSWRVLILPYLDAVGAYEQYDMGQTWDSKTNRTIEAIGETLFACPASHNESGSSLNSTTTSFVAVTGHETAWPNRGTFAREEILDAPSGTILFVETANSGIHWMEPRDLDIDEFLTRRSPNAASNSPHKNGTFIAFADSTFCLMCNNTGTEAVRALLTVNGGERVIRKDDTEGRCSKFDIAPTSPR
jgi:hypothetical protein